jgi:hypothetical protein
MIHTSASLTERRTGTGAIGDVIVNAAASVWAI